MDRDRRIYEDVTKGDIASAIESKLSSDEFRKKVKTICVQVLSDMYKTMWQKKSFWQGDVSR